MKAITTIFFALALCVPLCAQSVGGLSAEMLREVRGAGALGPSDKALANAVRGNTIDALAKVQGKAAPDTHFSVETKAQSITDQQSSGRCWMFSGLNVLRGLYAQRTDTLRVDYSQSYLFFYDQLEKANLFLQTVIDNASKPMDDPLVLFLFHSPIGDGGTFCGVADLADKYGLVPKEVMAETTSSDNTTRMSAIIKSKLREYGLALRKLVAGGKKPAYINKEKTRMLGTIYHILAMTLGEPPASFLYADVHKDGRRIGQRRQYTPQEFFRATVGEKLAGTYLMTMNDPRRPYYQTYEVELDRHTYDGTNWRYVNLPMDDICQMAIASLKDGRKLYSSYDVGKQLDRKTGFGDTLNYDYGSLLGISFPMTKADRISTFDSGSTHAMTLTAVDLDGDGKPVKWKVENSWGADWGQKGCMIMTQPWMEQYMFRLVVDKKYATAKVLEASKTKPVIIPPFDPLFAEDE